MYYNGCFFAKNPSQALSGKKTTYDSQTFCCWPHFLHFLMVSDGFAERSMLFASHPFEAIQKSDVIQVFWDDSPNPNHIKSSFLGFGRLHPLPTKSNPWKQLNTKIPLVSLTHLFLLIIPNILVHRTHICLQFSANKLCVETVSVPLGGLQDLVLGPPQRVPAIPSLWASAAVPFGYL